MKPHRRIVNQPVILMVEDEPLVRLTQVDILREAEIWVVEAQDADEAFELLKRRPDIRAVLTDVNMPGSMDGFEFARLVRQGWPEVGVLVISGKTGPGPGDLPPNADFLHKPILPDDLVAALRKVMAGHPQGSLTPEGKLRLPTVEISVIPGERSEGRESTSTQCAMDPLPGLRPPGMTPGDCSHARTARGWRESSTTVASAIRSHRRSTSAFTV